MRVVREARRVECEHQRQAQRSHLKKWLELGHAQDEAAPLAPSLKKAPSALAQKWSAYISAMGLKEGGRGGGALYASDDKKKKVGKHAKRQRHVRFDDERREEFERPEWTPEEKASCHYSTEELGEMASCAKKETLHREARVAAQPKDTILEQGFLTLQANTPFFQHKHYYCLLRGYNLALYASAAHAAKRAAPKCEFAVLRVQDIATLSMQKKIAMFGANLPQQLAHMFYVIKTNGERVVLTAESKCAKRNWVHTLARVTYVGEGTCSVSSNNSNSSSSSSSRSRHRSSSAPAACKKPADLPKISEEEEPEEPEGAADNISVEHKTRHASIDSRS